MHLYLNSDSRGVKNTEKTNRYHLGAGSGSKGQIAGTTAVPGRTTIVDSGEEKSVNLVGMEKYLPHWRTIRGSSSPRLLTE